MKNRTCILLAALITFSSSMLFGCSNKSCASDPDDAKFSGAVSYADFGAVGDGVTDDFDALKSAHEYANEHNVPVKAESGKKYYIPPKEDSITVKTDVDWTGAEFIIDDKSASKDSKVWWYSVFNVRSDTERAEVEIPENMSIKAGQTKLDVTFEKPVMLAVYNDNHKDFIRHTSGARESRQEILIVDENGNIDPSTPVQWAYDSVTRMFAYAMDDRPVLLRGGKFTTIANDDPLGMHYYERNIKVERSNTTVKNVNHFVTDEGDESSPYNGFFRTNYTCNVIFENCVMTGHKYYNQGTYDTRLMASNNVKYINCTQSNDIKDDKLWGIMCSDFCKNLVMQGCKLSRFDAHMGVYNATVKDSEIGQHISVTGGGTLLVENVVTYAKAGGWFNRFVTLRSDYGSFFYGDIIIKDSVMYTERGINYVIAADWYDWDFGYECRYPKTVTIDNVRLVTDTDVLSANNEYDHKCLYVFSQQSKDTTYETAQSSKNPPVLTEKVIIKNNFATTGEPETVFKMTIGGGGWFDSTVMETLS